jgi:hypothetical protein
LIRSFAGRPAEASDLICCRTTTMSPGKNSRRFLFWLAHSVCLNRRSCTRICSNSFCWNHNGNIVSTCCKALSPGLPMMRGSCSLTSNGKWKVLALAAKDRMMSVPSIGDPFQAYIGSKRRVHHPIGILLCIQPLQPLDLVQVSVEPLTKNAFMLFRRHYMKSNSKLVQ